LKESQTPRNPKNTKKKHLQRKMFAREVENAKVKKCNENLWPSMEDRGGDHRRKKLRRKKEARKQKHG